jgi:hypothetical protein
MSPIGISSSEKLSELFSLEEKDAIASFQGKAIYEYHQKIEKRPNILDTRETFLLKMDDQDARDKFLNELNSFQPNSNLSRTINFEIFSKS